jgi:hypothetical protein
MIGMGWLWQAQSYYYVPVFGTQDVLKVYLWKQSTIL